MNGSVDKIRIRMYDTGSVGDCILLLFEKKGAVSFSMLIDCGGIKTTAALVTPCANDIKAACAGALDLLVVTHQHEDHISGFNLARKVFDEIKVKEAWMSWVEDKTDPIAIQLKDKYGKKLKELANAAQSAAADIKKFRSTTSSVQNFAKRQEKRKLAVANALSMLDFEQRSFHGIGIAKAVGGRLTNEDAMDYIKKKPSKMTYKLPGDVVKDMAGAEGIKFYILGPPRDKDLKFMKIEMDDDEMYELAQKTAAEDGSTPEQPQGHISESGVALEPKKSPFSPSFILVNAEKAAFMKKYNNPHYKWRQIETDWLESPGGLALALNRFINNTSLAMALEFEGSGKVVLLPGDAQSGNWMSWHKPDVMKALKNNGGKDTNELLASTVFYKVGHHGSHNGTASQSGLELIPDTNLVAFMPLVQDKVPAAWGGAANFPAAKLYSKIIEKTKGKLVRTDQGVVSDPKAASLRKLLSTALSNDFNKNFIKGPCYFEYSVQQ